MAFFVARRLLYLVPVLIAVSLLTFSIASLLPGDLAYTILGDQATPENVAALRRDVIHEATHALQDWDRYESLDRYTAEGAAYLAGAITYLQWGGGARDFGDRMAGPHAYALWLALQRRDQGRLNSPAEFRVSVDDRVNLASTRGFALGAAERYVYNGIRNQARRPRRHGQRR